MLTKKQKVRKRERSYKLHGPYCYLGICHNLTSNMYLRIFIDASDILGTSLSSLFVLTHLIMKMPSNTQFSYCHTKTTMKLVVGLQTELTELAHNI
jgi:hypothetical protein